MAGPRSEPTPAEDSIRRAMSSTETVTEIPIAVNENVTIMPVQVPQKKRWLTTHAPATHDQVALVAAALGVLGGVGVSLAPSLPPLGLYMMAIAAFHLLEFWVTARYNERSLGMHSFLLLNGVEYAFAHFVAVTEYLVKRWAYGAAPQWSMPGLTLVAGAVVVGQAVRTASMIHAATSFNHYVQQDHVKDHVLVKSGVYAYIRHPSYFGYFVWTVSSQILLRNWITATISTGVLTYYFKMRLRSEEAALIRFFGDEYRRYKQEVWSGIPFWP